MANTPNEQTGKVLSWLKLIAGIRDGVLVIAGILYILGYLFWAINAFQNNLGLLPAIESQYFVAGIVPMFVILALLLAITGIKLIREKIPAWLGPSVKGWRLVLRWIIIAWLLFGLAGFSMVSEVLPEGDWVTIFFYVYFISWVFFPPYPFGHKSEGEYGETKILRFIRKFFDKTFPGILATAYPVFLAVGLSTAGLNFFIEDVYPSIPQEFGGVRPRCAQLDVVADQLSVETREAILPIDSIDSENQVVQTIEVNVFFSGSEFMLVRPLAQEQEPKLEVYEIRTSVIQAVTWCSQRDNR